MPKTTALNFTPLKAGGASSTGAEFAFSIQSRGGGHKGVCFSICQRIVKAAGWSHDTRLRLGIDAKARKGQLVAVDDDDDDGRKLHVNSVTGRGLYYFPWSGDALDYFEPYERPYELDGVEIEKDEYAVTFDLPPAPDAEAESAAEDETS